MYMYMYMYMYINVYRYISEIYALEIFHILF